MHLIKQRDGFEWHGKARGHRIIHARGDVERDRAGRVVAAQS